MPAGRSWGLGPVFGFECLTVPRRWQVFAGRAVFVGAMLATMWLLWAPDSVTFTNHNHLAAFGNRLFQSLIIIQIGVILLVAPVATAGSICVDKSRGTLYHVFVTDLTDREIVLGKLGARLLSLIAFLLCCVPVMAIGGLLGGVPYGAIVGAFLVSTGVAVLASCLAMMMSVWVRKPHQALLVTYLLLGLWVAIYPAFARTPLSKWLLWSNPVGMALAPFLPGGDELTLLLPAVFLLGTILGSSVLVRVSIRKLRPVAIRQMDRPKRREKTGVPGRFLDLLPGPPLDGNPVLWREWHRKKPTKWTGRFWTTYVISSSLASLFVIVAYFLDALNASYLAAIVNGWEVAIGLLLLTISATTSLAEERDRGSLDVIMTTPLSSRTILWGKWLGTFAMVPRMAILPVWVTTGLALVGGNAFEPILMIGLLLSMAAAVTSMGIAVATWIPRLGRAIAVGVLIYAIGSFGILFLRQALIHAPAYSRPPVSFIASRMGPNGMVTYIRTTTIPLPYYNPVAPYLRPPDPDYLLLANPYYAISETTTWAGHFNFNPNEDWNPQSVGPYKIGENKGRSWAIVWIAAYSISSLTLVGLVLLTFDRCLGRITQTTPNWGCRDALNLPSPLP